MRKITLAKHVRRSFYSRNPSIYADQIATDLSDFEPGDVAELESAKGRFLGVGFVNPNSRIAFRIAAFEPTVIDAGFLMQRIRTADGLRAPVREATDAYRVFHGEADGLPGLVIDRYADCIVVQMLFAGVDRLRGELIEVLGEFFHPCAIVARNDAPVRLLEGLPQVKEVLRGEPPETVIVREGRVRLAVDVLSGQKTGMFLDQRENRMALGPLAAGRDVLDCFSYTGVWAVHTALGGARSVLAVDSSAPAIATASRNAELNGVADRIVFERANVFNRVRTLRQEGRRFGCIVLDPPAFARTASARKKAIRGYVQINMRVMGLLERGGILATSSCTQVVDRTAFLDAIKEASRRVGGDMRIIRQAGAARDHPVLLSTARSEYLKCYFLQRLE